MKAIIANRSIINGIILKHDLFNFNFDFHFAKDGQEVLDLLKLYKEFPCILFLEIYLPIINGYKVMIELKDKFFDYPTKLATICITGVSKTTFFENVETTHYDYHLEKPINNKLLHDYTLKCIKKLTKSSHMN
jgi:CheY-like chemotaxis protein